ncbi:hypothetical protein H2202_010416 [Exophiala xenobiotica]|nr:hypothetical protein H2202_010416 [Exophiala xenobiotica]
MSLVHIVLFKLKSSLSDSETKEGGFTHGFVVEFASKEDRDYYIARDPTHLAFVKKNSPRFDDVRVIDYEKGVY